MRELSLFSGAGGGLLGTHCLLGWQTVGYVEINDYCQRVIAQRIKDGYLDEAPIFGDIKTFISEGYARAYKDLVDVISAGVPCQPASYAGQRRGADDERWLWPETVRCIDIIRPQGFLLENPPGILSVFDPDGRPEIGRILRDLAEIGFHPRWDGIPASALGAPHERDRIWFVADTDGTVQSIFPGGRSASRTPGNTIFKSNSWWQTEPGIPRVDDGMAVDVVSRNRAIGEGQVPIVVASVWELLNEER